MCFDAEGVKTRASELGFAWLQISDICDIAPGKKCQNWWPFIKAKHFLRQKHAKLANKYTDGNPKGFWSEYENTEPYSADQGTTLFDRMLLQILDRSLTAQVVASDDAAPVVPPHVPKRAALVPHLRNPASTTHR